MRIIIALTLCSCVSLISAGTDIILKDLQGQEHKLVNKSASLTLIHFWASWCVPCRHELPQLISVASELEDKGAQLILVAADSRAAIDRYVKQHQLATGVLVDQYGSALRKYRIRVLPSTVILDRQGMIVASEHGARDWRSDEMTELLSGLLH